MQDILTSIKAYLYDRAVSPLTGAFVSAWAVWNYRFFVVLLSPGDSNPESKFKFIDHHFSASTIAIGDFSYTINGALLNGLLIPTALAFSYLFIYPVIAKPVYEHSLKKQKELKSIKQEQENQRLLSVEESREIYRRLAQMQSKHQDEVDSYNNQISSLNQHIETLEKNSDSKPQVDTELNKTEDEISDIENLQEHDNFIRESLEFRNPGTFRLNQLFGQDDWSNIPSTTRQALGKRFRKQVERGDFVDVTMRGKDSGNQQMYYKG